MGYGNEYSRDASGGYDNYASDIMNSNPTGDMGMMATDPPSHNPHQRSVAWADQSGLVEDATASALEAGLDNSYQQYGGDGGGEVGVDGGEVITASEVMNGYGMMGPHPSYNEQPTEEPNADTTTDDNQQYLGYSKEQEEYYNIYGKGGYQDRQDLILQNTGITQIYSDITYQPMEGSGRQRVSQEPS